MSLGDAAMMHSRALEPLCLWVVSSVTLCRSFLKTSYFKLHLQGPWQDLNRLHWMLPFFSIPLLPNLIITTTRCDRLLLKAILMSPMVPLRMQVFYLFLLLSLAGHLGSDACPRPISHEASFCWNNPIMGPRVEAMGFHNQILVQKEKIINHLSILRGQHLGTGYCLPETVLSLSTFVSQCLSSMHLKMKWM